MFIFIGNLLETIVQWPHFTALTSTLSSFSNTGFHLLPSLPFLTQHFCLSSRLMLQKLAWRPFSLRVIPRLHPCSFFSYHLASKKWNYHIEDCELLAIKLALEVWRHCFEAAQVPFLFWTDHRNLKYLKTAKPVGPLSSQVSISSSFTDLVLRTLSLMSFHECLLHPKNLHPQKLSYPPIACGGHCFRY